MINNSDNTNRKVSESESENEIDPHFEPVVTLPEIEVSTNEENEEELIKLRAKLFRFDTSDPEEPEWKERGTGEVKLLKHKENKSIRVVMRRDKTLKICANHFITPTIELLPSAGSNRAWVWSVPLDFADEKPKAELLAIRFATPEIAKQWKEKFLEAQNILKTECELYKDDYADHNSSLSSESEEENSDKKEKSEENVIEKLANLDVTK